MAKRVLDTNVLIAHWRGKLVGRAGVTPKRVREWAEQVIQLHQTDAIVTPVYIEMIAGVQSQRELQLTRIFLQCFACVDERRILAQDWEEAIRLAQRVPPDGKPRQLGDCLIQAIAKRLRYEVVTKDLSFPK
jgi:predicted nucleic acid-binding protein